MHKRKLIGLLRTFEPEEWKRFEEYLRSPFFNKRDASISLLKALQQAAPQFTASATDRFRIWGIAFPKHFPTEEEITIELNILTQHAEAFLGLSHYLSNNRLRELQVLDAMERRQLSKNYRLQHKRLKKLSAASETRNAEHFLFEYQMASIELRETLQNKARTYDASLQQMAEYLDDFYLIARLRITCELLNRQSILSGAYNAEAATELMNYLRHYDHERVPALSAYYLVLGLLTGEGEMPEFQKLTQLLSLDSKAIDSGEWQDLFSYAQNYCIRKVRAGESGFLEELFVLYQLGLKTGNMLESDVLSPWKYKNIASVGLRLEEFEWVETFIEDYKTKLPVDFQENAYAYNLADLYYRRGEYEKALRRLLKVEFTDVFYSLDTRKMMLMIYFEQGEGDAMRSLLASFRLFLKRNTLVSEGNRKAYTNFVNLVQSIYKRSSSKAEIQAIMKKIDETRPLVEEDWLMEMAKIGFQER